MIKAIFFAENEEEKITGFAVTCEPIARNDLMDLVVKEASSDMLAIQYGHKDRDLFMVKKDEFVRAIAEIGRSKS